MSTRRWSREPLLWFALLGLALFFFSRKEEFAAVEIQVSRDVITRLDDQWQMQMGRPASEQELDGLVSDWVREEIYAREAQSLGLDRDDTIIRRRLVQKLRFLTEDLALAEPPTEAALAAYFDEHANRYHIPDRIDFEHRYFSKDRREDATADAAAALAAMQNPEPVQTRELGDAFLLQREFFARSERQISDLFGRAFAEALFAKEFDGWFGPVPSAYGAHLVRVTGRIPGRSPALAEVRQQVLADYGQARRDTANNEFYEQLKSRYRIVRDARAAQP